MVVQLYISSILLYINLYFNLYFNHYFILLFYFKSKKSLKKTIDFRNFLKPQKKSSSHLFFC